MTPENPGLPIWLVPIVLAALIGGLWWYLRAASQVRHADGPGVSTSTYGPLEYAIAGFYIVWFLFVVVMEMVARDPDAGAAAGGVTRDAILLNLGITFGLLAFLLGALKANNQKLRALFGLDRVAGWRVPIVALIWILPAFPLVSLGSALVQPFINEPPAPQAALQFFYEANDPLDKWLLALMAVVAAPVFEEVVFRGFFYPVLKRFAGGLASAVFGAALFSAVHLYLPAVFAFFILGLCLTLAYERTGSLAVPIGMHMIFNATTLLIAIYAPQALPS